MVKNMEKEEKTRLLETVDRIINEIHSYELQMYEKQKELIKIDGEINQFDLNTTINIANATDTAGKLIFKNEMMRTAAKQDALEHNEEYIKLSAMKQNIINEINFAKINRDNALRQLDMYKMFTTLMTS
jgi:hypothetical protein